MPPAWRRQVAGPAAATLWSVAAGRFEVTQHGPSCAQGRGSELGAFLQWVGI